MPKIRIEYDIVTTTTYREDVYVESVQEAVDMAGAGCLGDDYEVDKEVTKIKARKVWIEEDGVWVSEDCPEIDWVVMGLTDLTDDQFTQV